MGNRSMTVLVSAGLLLAGAKVLADDVHYYEQNGITYREVRRTIEERVPETTLQQWREPSIGNERRRKREIHFAPAGPR